MSTSKQTVRLGILVEHVFFDNWNILYSCKSPCWESGRERWMSPGKIYQVNKTSLATGIASSLGKFFKWQDFDWEALQGVKTTSDHGKEERRQSSPKTLTTYRSWQKKRNVQFARGAIHVQFLNNYSFLSLRQPRLSLTKQTTVVNKRQRPSLGRPLETITVYLEH